MNGTGKYFRNIARKYNLRDIERLEFALADEWFRKNKRKIRKIDGKIVALEAAIFISIEMNNNLRGDW